MLSWFKSRGEKPSAQVDDASRLEASRSALLSEASTVGQQLTSLMLDVDRVAASVYLGAHGRRRAGTGESFWQFRDLSPGEAISRIDWRQSAKRDGTFVREMEWDAAQTVSIPNR